MMRRLAAAALLLTMVCLVSGCCCHKGCRPAVSAAPPCCPLPAAPCGGAVPVVPGPVPAPVPVAPGVPMSSAAPSLGSNPAHFVGR